MVIHCRFGHSICLLYNKLTHMADNKQLKTKQDRLRVDANDPNEVEYLHRQFPKKYHQQIVDAIKVAGPMRANIIRYLEGKM